MRIDGFADGGTRISNHKPAKTVRMYITLHLRQKNKDKRHCACVLTGLQMVGHISPTTSMLRRPHIYCASFNAINKDKTPLRMRIDGFADGGTHISNHKHAKTVRIYSALHLMQ